MILASKSTWFHNFFQSVNKTGDCSIVFFNVNEVLINKCIDLIYGKKIEIPSNLKTRMMWLLKKLGISWQDNTEDDSGLDQPEMTRVEQSEKGKVEIVKIEMEVDIT